MSGTIKVTRRLRGSWRSAPIEAENIPEKKSASSRLTPGKKQEQTKRPGGDDDIADSGRNGEVPRKLTAGMEIKKIKSHKTDKMVAEHRAPPERKCPTAKRRRSTRGGDEYPCEREKENLRSRRNELGRKSGGADGNRRREPECDKRRILPAAFQRPPLRLKNDTAWRKPASSASISAAVL